MRKKAAKKKARRTRAAVANKVPRVRALSSAAYSLDMAESYLGDALQVLGRIEGARLRGVEHALRSVRLRTDDLWREVVDAKNRACGVRG